MGVDKYSQVHTHTHTNTWYLVAAHCTVYRDSTVLGFLLNQQQVGSSTKVAMSCQITHPHTNFHKTITVDQVNVHSMHPLKAGCRRTPDLRIGIAKKIHKTRRDHWGGNVNHKSLF